MIQLIMNESGDWEILKADINGKTFCCEGHSISNYQWVQLLRMLGYDVEEKCIQGDISEEDM